MILLIFIVVRMNFRLFLEKILFEDFIKEGKQLTIFHYEHRANWDLKIATIYNKNERDIDYESELTFLNITDGSDIPEFDKIFQSFENGNKIVIDMRTNKIYAKNPVNIKSNKFEQLKLYDGDIVIVFTNKYESYIPKRIITEFDKIIENDPKYKMTFILTKKTYKTIVKPEQIIKVAEAIDKYNNSGSKINFILEVTFFKDTVKLEFIDHIIMLPYDELHKLNDVLKYSIYYKTKQGVVYGRTSIINDNLDHSKEIIELSNGSSIIKEKFKQYIEDFDYIDASPYIIITLYKSRYQTLIIEEYNTKEKVKIPLRSEYNINTDDLSELLAQLVDLLYNVNNGEIYVAYTSKITPEKMISILPTINSGELTRINKDNLFSLKFYKVIKLLYYLFMCYASTSQKSNIRKI